MKRFLLFITLLVALIVVVILLPELATAQSPPPLPSKPTQNPVDGGLAILAAAGGAYAINRLRNRKE